MLPSSTNSPGASLHQTHGFPPPSAHFGPPSAMLKTFGNVLTLLLTGTLSSLSAIPIPIPQAHPVFQKRALLQPRIFSLQQPQTSLANSQQTPTPQILLTATYHFSWHFTCRQLRFLFSRQNIQTLRLPLTSNPARLTSSPHSPSPPATPPDFSVSIPASESEIYTIPSNSLLNSHQSAYCKHHSTETALLYIHDYLISAMGS